MSSTRAVLALALSLFAAGCTPPATQQVDLAAEQAALLQTDQDFSDLSRDSSAAAAFEHYLAEDALVLSAGGEPTGRDSLVAGMPSNLVLTWDPQRAEVSVGADMGWTWGRYEARSTTPEGEELISYGKYLNVWSKQPDGSWRVVVDIGNANPNPDASGAAEDR